MQAVTNNKKFYQKTWFVILALWIFGPLGLYLTWAKTTWPKWVKIGITVVLLSIYLYIYITDVSKRPSLTTNNSTNTSQTDTKSATKPTISITSAKDVDGVLTITKQKADTSFTITTGSLADKTTDTKLTINGTTVEADKDFSPNYFRYSTTLKPGDNKFTIVATNAAGTDEKALVIKYEQKTAATPDPILEAEITCQEYAQKQLEVEDINISYDQSSIKKKQADGTIIIKVNIADSQGLIHQEKPLGIMECTTDATGMKVNNFINY